MSNENMSVVTRDNFIDGVKNSEGLSVSRKGTLVEAIGTESDPSKILGTMYEVLESKTNFAKCRKVDVTCESGVDCLRDDEKPDEEEDCTTCETKCGEQFI